MQGMRRQIGTLLRQARMAGTLVTSAVAATLLVVSLTPAVASAAGGADPAIAGALKRIYANAYSADDIALIKRHPELARVVVDPSRTTITTSADSGFVHQAAGKQTKAGQSASPRLAGGCGPVGVTITVYTMLGFDLFKWTHHVEACFDGYNVTSVSVRRDYLNYADPTVYFRELTATSVTPLGTEVRSFMQRHLEQCIIKYGCYSNWYPYSTIILQGQGYWSYTWGVA